MTSQPSIRQLSMPLWLLFVFLFLFAVAPGIHAQLVAPSLIQKAQSQGQVPVIVRLTVSDSSEAWIESDIVRGLRRAEIARGRDSVRAGLFNVAHRVRHEFEDFPFIALHVGADGLRTLDSLHGVVAEVIEDRLRRPFLAESIPLVQADQVWAGDFGGTPLDGSGTVVAVLDTGVDKNHPFLSGKVVEEACFSTNAPAQAASSVCPGGVESSTATGSGMPCTVSDCEHGTHVAGIAAGNGQDGGVASFSGIAKGADIMAVKVFTRFDDPTCFFAGVPSPCVGAFDSDVMAGLQRVFNRRAVHNFAAVNMSLGGDLFTANCNSNPMKPIIDSLRAANIATVVASGNESQTNAISAPACISSAVSVGSTRDGSVGTTADTVSSFSNSASFLSLLAPGEWINSSIAEIFGGGFDNFRGTSMATPHVVGAFAILKQAVPNATVSQILSALQNTGLPVLDTRNSITKPRIRILDALSQLPAMQFDSATYSVNENGGSATITVTRTGATTDVSTVRYATSNGTATAPGDYTAKSGTLTFNTGETTKTFTIPIINDTLDENDETVNLTLSNPTGGALGDQSTAVLTIADNDTAGTVQFSSATFNVSETNSTATITVTRTGGTASGVAVNYATSDGTATAGSDYTAKSGTLTFGSGETTKTFTVTIVNDTLDENDETVNLTLSNPAGGTTLGSPSTAVLTVTDDDTAGTVQFSAATYNVNESGLTAKITVTRAGGTASGVTVNYATSDGTAIAGLDYTAQSSTLTFASGQLSRTFTIPIINDKLDESDETVNLTLANPTGGAQLGPQSTAVLNVIDNDSGGALRFSSATYSVNEGVLSGKAVIKVTRSGGTASGVTVDYAITGGTAIAGSDFNATNGTLTFNAGQTSKTFTVDIINDTIDEPNETVNLALSNPQGGATLGTPNTAVLTIVNNDIAYVRGLYTLFPGSSTTLAACSIIPSLNGTFDTTGSINISGQSSRNFSGTGTLFFTDNAPKNYKLAVTLSGTVAPGGEQLSGTFSFNTSIPPSTAIVARGTGTFTGLLSGNTLTVNPIGQVNSGETCQLTGTLTGTRPPP